MKFDIEVNDTCYIVYYSEGAILSIYQCFVELFELGLVSRKECDLILDSLQSLVQAVELTIPLNTATKLTTY